MVNPGHGFFLLVAAGGGPSLSGSSFRLGVPHQTRVQTPLPEVHAPRYLGSDLSIPADSQRPRKNNVGKEEGYLRVPTPIKNPPPFHCQDSHKLVPHCTGGRGVPAHLLSSEPAPTSLPCRVVHDSPVQVRPVVVMQEVSIYSLQQQVRTFRGESREVFVFLWGGWRPPQRD